MTTMDTASISPAWVLRNVALYLDRHGWTPAGTDRHRLCTPLGTMCLDCAVCMVVYGGIGTGTSTKADDTLIWRTMFALAMCLDGVDWIDEFGEDLDPDAVVYAWEDQPGRTPDAVITNLRDAADEYEYHHPEVRS
jgi:hypothetical protein